MNGTHQKTYGAEKSIGKQRKILIVSAILAVFAVAVALFLLRDDIFVSGVPTLTVETPQKISAGSDETIMIDVSISDLGEVLYPAMSLSLGFDSSRLEFLGVIEGNTFILGDANGAGIAQKMPDWSCNVQQSNEAGLINIMYLDMTGGRYAFSKALLAEDDNVVMRLNFRLRGSARAGDVLDLTVEDAVFAASDETQSLAMTTNTLNVRNGRIVVGD